MGEGQQTNHTSPFHVCDVVRKRVIVIDTFPKVAQFWKYSPAEYLRDPLYAR